MKWWILHAIVTIAVRKRETSRFDIVTMKQRDGTVTQWGYKVCKRLSRPFVTECLRGGLWALGTTQEKGRTVNRDRPSRPAAVKTGILSDYQMTDRSGFTCYLQTPVCIVTHTLTRRLHIAWTLKVEWVALFFHKTTTATLRTMLRAGADRQRSRLVAYK